MKDERNIDELFKSQLGDFEATPSPEVWERIEAQLKKKKDRKVIPLWWKVGGVAALLALLLMVGNSLFVSDSSNEIVIEDKEIVNPQENDKINQDKIFTETDAVATDEDAKNRSNSDSENQTVKDLNPADIDHDEMNEGIANSQEKNNSNIKQKILQDPSSSKNTNRIAETKEAHLNEVKERDRNKITQPNELKLSEENGIAQDQNDTNKNIQEPKDLNKEKSNIILEEGVAKDAGIAEENIEKTQEEVKNPEDKKKSIFDAIEENKKEAIAQTEEKNRGGWEVTPNVGPVYYNSINGGSSIDPSFSDNSQTGEVNFSYGVQVAYEVSERFSVRSGVNNVNVGYATGGIEVASGPAAFGLESVAYDNPGRNVLTVFDKGTIPNVPVDPNDPYAQLNLKSTTGNAEIRQSISYFEVPLEAKYKLVNSRFGVNMIGGFSTLFLNDSEISVNDNGFRSVLGEANNLNSVSFSTNIGLGFDYNLSERFKLNLEPIFKYQINPYTDSSVDFNPYYFGIYSGLSFKF